MACNTSQFTQRLLTIAWAYPTGFWILSLQFARRPMSLANCRRRLLKTPALRKGMGFVRELLMVTSFRRLSLLGDASPDDIVVHIARARGSAKARVLLPVSLGTKRSLEYVSLEEAAALARSAGEKHGMALVVVIDSSSGLTWQPEWNAWFGE
jgi:hypothetical protein